MEIRKEIINQLVPYFKEDKRLYLLYGDMGFGALDKFKEELPNRSINIGIMEQTMVGIAAGMAMNGMIPVVYHMPNFLMFRALEQIRNDVILQNQNVKFIATGCNDYFKGLGKSHTCGEQDMQICDMIRLEVFDTFVNAAEPIELMIADFMLSPHAGYLRV